MAEFLVVAGADCLQGVPVEELLIGRRQPQEPRRLPGVSEEPLDACRPEEQEQTSFRRVDVERVRDVARTKDDRARHRFHHCLPMPERNLAREDDEERTLRSVDMEG